MEISILKSKTVRIVSLDRNDILNYLRYRGEIIPDPPVPVVVHSPGCGDGESEVYLTIEGNTKIEISYTVDE